MSSNPDEIQNRNVEDPSINPSEDLIEPPPLAAAELQEQEPNPAENNVETREMQPIKRNDRSLITIYSRWERTSKNRLAQIQNFTRKKKVKCTLLVVAAVAAPILIWLPSDPLTALLTRILLSVLIAFIVALLAAKRLSFPPDRMHFTDNGLSLEWEPGVQSGSTPVVPWHRVLYVGISKCRGILFCDNWLDIHIQTTDMSEEDKVALAWFFRDFSLYQERSRIYIDLEGVAFSDDARRLLKAIALNVPRERIDPQLIDFLNPPKQESYTELWLSSLSSSTDRLRNDPLAGGTDLQKGRYTIIDQIGAGGQGIAYRARIADTVSLAKVAATDVVNPSATAPEKTASAEDSDKVAVLKEFILPSHGGKTVRKRSLDDVEREAELLKQIAHPHIVGLKEFFVEDERAYLVLEHINGRSLRAIVEEKGPLDSATFREITMQLCDILAHLHGQEIPVIHRDFTPENIMIGESNFATLIDFNVAKQLQSTATKTVVGKHAYIPPEQFRGKATPQSDIYALGATMYFMLTGEDPEPISSSHPQSLNKGVSDALDALVARATATDAQERYADIATLKSDLQELNSTAAARSSASSV